MSIARAQRKLERFVKRKGTIITLRWLEWPDGKPEADPINGATLATEDSTPEPASCQTKALVHFVSPAATALRVHAEVETGDCILDFTAPLVRVIDAGDTPFLEGDVVDAYAFNAANRALAAGQEHAQDEAVELDDLDQLTFEIDGERWVQKAVGEELAKSWDAIVGGRKFSRSILLTKGK